MEFPELQGLMGGICAREQGEPEEVWKAIYYHYLPGWRRDRRSTVQATAWRRRGDMGFGRARRQT